MLPEVENDKAGELVNQRSPVPKEERAWGWEGWVPEAWRQHCEVFTVMRRQRSLSASSGDGRIAQMMEETEEKGRQKAVL
jgi:uncharacterized protein CbrC (UPF0167 family)